MAKKTSSSFTICHIFALEINYFPVLSTVRALLARSPKRNRRKVVSGSRVTLPENFACKPELSFNPLARVTLAVGLPYLLVNRALSVLFPLTWWIFNRNNSKWLALYTWLFRKRLLFWYRRDVWRAVDPTGFWPGTLLGIKGFPAWIRRIMLFDKILYEGASQK